MASRKVSFQEKQSINLFCNANNNEYIISMLAQRSEAEFKDCESPAAKKLWIELHTHLQRAANTMDKMKSLPVK